MATAGDGQEGERADLLRILDDERHNFLITVRDIDDEQARRKTTVSELTLGGLVKHVAATESSWINRILEPDQDEQFDLQSAMESHVMTDSDTLAGLLERYDAVRQRTESAIKQVSDLDTLVPLPLVPWAPERQWWSARFILLHVIRETAQHAGHADIIRESLDGANTTRQMGADAGMDV